MAEHLWEAKQSEWKCVACGHKESYVWPPRVSGKVTVENNAPYMTETIEDAGKTKTQQYSTFSPTGDCEVMKLVENLKMYVSSLATPYPNYNTQSWPNYIDTLEKALGIMMEIDLKTPCGFQAKLAQFSKPYQR